MAATGVYTAQAGDAAGTLDVTIANEFGCAPVTFTLNTPACGVVCTPPDIPTVTASPTTVCPNVTSTLSITGNLNDATNWHIYTGSCGGTAVGTTASNSFAVMPSVTTTYFIRGEDGAGCVDETTGLCAMVTVTVTDVAPVITCPADVTIECGTDSTPTATGSATATDDCDPAPSITFVDIVTPSACPQASTITRTWTATDAVEQYLPSSF